MSQPSTPYYALQLAANLRFDDLNGNLVTQLFPVAPTQGQDNPTTGYISLIGARLSSTIDLVNDIETVLATYNQRITTLEEDVAAIQASGATALPYINGGCLNGSTSERVDVITSLLVTNSCDYNEVLGTTSQLSSGIAALDNSALNVLPAYSQNSAMAGLAGWISSPTTVGQWMNNISLAYLDMRTGVTRALSQSDITCGSIDINITGAYNSSTRTINLYFPGSNIPDNFADNTSHLLVEDSAGNQFTMNFNVITAVMTNGYLNVDISASTLIQTSDYTVTFTYDVTSTTPALGCSNNRIVVITNTTAVCPNLSIWAGPDTVSFTFVPPITTNVVYDVDLLDASGTTVLDTKTFTNPTTAIVDTFTGLANSTSYNVRVTTIVSQQSTICSSYGITTTSP